MRIEKPLDDYDIYIVYDFLDDIDYMYQMRDAAINALWYNTDHNGEPLINDFERSILQEPLPPRGGAEEPSQALLEEKMKAMLHQIYKDDSVVKYHFYQGPNIRTPDGGLRKGPMKQHVDGPHEDLGQDHGVTTYGAVYYLNDGYDGGELVYPKLNFKFKPAPNSLIMHPGKEPYWHGVAEIYNGWRMCLGMLATEYYNPDDYITYR